MPPPNLKSWLVAGNLCWLAHAARTVAACHSTPAFRTPRARPWSLQSPGSLAPCHTFEHCLQAPPRSQRLGRRVRSLCQATHPPTLRMLIRLTAHSPPSPFLPPPPSPLQPWPSAAPAVWRPLTDLGAASGYNSPSLPRPVCSFSEARLHACAERIRTYVQVVVLLCHRKANSVGPEERGWP